MCSFAKGRVQSAHVVSFLSLTSTVPTQDHNGPVVFIGCYWPSLSAKSLRGRDVKVSQVPGEQQIGRLFPKPFSSLNVKEYPGLGLPTPAYLPGTGLNSQQKWL